MFLRSITIACSVLVMVMSTGACTGKTVFDPKRKTLYTQAELWKGFDADSEVPGFDDRVYKEYLGGNKFFPDPGISKLRSQHDEGIASALRAYARDVQRNIIGVMGSGNAGIRCTPEYEKTVQVAWLLAHDGKFLVATGGGPGQMEAANLGAYLAAYGSQSIDEALRILRTDIDRNPNTKGLRRLQSQGCKYKDEAGKDDHFAYTAAAKAVTDKFPAGQETLGVPTWFYGNEPPNVFATSVAKFFSNGVREDLLVTLAMGGLVVAPGSAGTRQEVFMDMTQNYYNSFCYRSPVVFVGKDYWGPLAAETKDSKIVEPENDGVYALVHKLASPAVREQLSITDEGNEVLLFLKAHHAKPDANPPEGCDKMP